MAFETIHDLKSWRHETQRKRPAAADSVRKCLFGAPDHDAMRVELLQQLSASVREASQKWNFDFSKARPKEGRYQWVPVFSRNDEVHDIESAKEELSSEQIATRGLSTSPLTKVKNKVVGSEQQQRVPVAKRNTQKSLKISDIVVCQRTVTDMFHKRKRPTSEIASLSKARKIQNYMEKTPPFKRAKKE